MFLEVWKCTKNLRTNAQLWARNFKEESLWNNLCQWGLMCIMLVPILNVPGRIQKREFWWCLESIGRTIEVSGRVGTALFATEPSDGMYSLGGAGTCSTGVASKRIYTPLKGFLGIQGDAEHFLRILQSPLCKDHHQQRPGPASWVCNQCSCIGTQS